MRTGSTIQRKHNCTNDVPGSWRALLLALLHRCQTQRVELPVAHPDSSMNAAGIKKGIEWCRAGYQYHRPIRFAPPTLTTAADTTAASNNQQPTNCTTSYSYHGQNGPSRCSNPNHANSCNFVSITCQAPTPAAHLQHLISVLLVHLLASVRLRSCATAQDRPAPQRSRE